MALLVKATYTQSWPAKPTWSIDEIPDLTGRVMIVTGGNTGLGKETVKVLLNRNAKVYIAARDPARAENAIKDLKELTGKEAHFIRLDLADLKSVKSAAEEYASKETQLHVLFNNAGVFCPPVNLTTADGYDLQFGTNVLGHFYFTKLLLPILTATGKSSPDGRARIVNTSSLTSYLCWSLNFNTFKDGPARRKYGTRSLYAQSKYANIVLSNELARRYDDQGILSVSLNPGNIQTELLRYVRGLEKLFLDSILRPIELGVLSQLWAGTAPEALNAQGKFLVPWAKLGTPQTGTDDPKLGEDLWAWLEEQVVNL